MTAEELRETIENEMSTMRRALEWLENHADDLEEGEEIDLNEIMRAIAEEAEYNRQIAEENSLRNAWQDDVIESYRRER